MADHVLSVWRAGEGAVRLWLAGSRETIAEFVGGFDDSPLLVGGNAVDPDSCLTGDGLMDRDTNAAVGAILWERLTAGDIGAAVKSLLKNDRIYLDLRSDELLRLPWELLRLGNANLFTGARLALGSPEPHRDYPAGEPPAPDHPLRILVVLGNDPSDATIRADQELLIIERQARRHNAEVLLRALHRPAAGEIEAALTAFRPHVFHFIGHGETDPAEPPQVYVSTSTGSSTAWNAGRIVEVFAQSPPRLVVLNACQTGSAALVRAFTEAGCIAVVAMMGRIDGAASEHFSERFYGAVFDGEPVDAAVAIARRSLSTVAAGVIAGRELEIQSNWALPRLTVHGDAATAVSMPYVGSRAADVWLIPDFVARWSQRWRAWTAMDGSLRADGAEARLVVLYGSPDQGKRELLRALAEARHRAGDAVLYVDLAGSVTGRWFDVLRHVVTAAERAGFDTADLTATLTSGGASAPVIERFRAGLERLGTGPLLVIVNGLSDWMSDEVDSTILPELCAPYLRAAPSSRVRLMITLKDLPAEPPWGRRPRGWEPIEVGPFDADEWPHAIHLFSEYWTDRFPARRDALIPFVTAMKGAPFASSLHYLRALAKETPR